MRVTSCNSVWNSLERRALTFEVCMVHVYGANRERLYLLNLLRCCLTLDLTSVQQAWMETQCLSILPHFPQHHQGTYSMAQVFSAILRNVALFSLKLPYSFSMFPIFPQNHHRFAQIPPGMLKAIENGAWKTQKWNLKFAQLCQNLVKMKKL